MGIWNPDFLKVGFQMVWFSNGRALVMGTVIVPTIQNWTIQNWTIQNGSRFQMILDKMAPICPDFKWLCFRISDPIWNPDHFQPNLFLTIPNPNRFGFQIPTVQGQAKYSDCDCTSKNWHLLFHTHCGASRICIVHGFAEGGPVLTSFALGSQPAGKN